jgi:hypothetical protein
MAYDFLNETTFSKDLASQNDILEMLMSGKDKADESDNDLVELPSNESSDNPEETEQNESEDLSETMYDFENEELDDVDTKLISFLFQKKDNSTGAGSLINTQNVVSDNQLSDLSWLKKKSENVKISNLNSKISKYLSGLPENLKQKLTATSGNDQQHVKNSKHYNNNALDLRYDEDLYNFIQNDPVRQELGLKLLNPNHGTAKHLHLEYQYGGKYNIPEAKTGIYIKPENRGKFTASANRAGMGVQAYARKVLNDPNASPLLKKRANFAINAAKWKHQFGGSTLVANDEQTLRTGLNNNTYDSAILKLSGNNTIRGLDSNIPIAVTDGTKYKVLKGPNDTDVFKNNVYEKRLM